MGKGQSLPLPFQEFTTCRAVMPKSELSSAERVLARAGWELFLTALGTVQGWTPRAHGGCFFLDLASPRFGV